MFLGDVISKEGVRPDPNVLKSVLQIPVPTDRKSVQRMLGLATYFGKYLPHLSQKMEALRELLKQGTLFEWTQAHDREWQNLKEDLAYRQTAEC